MTEQSGILVGPTWERYGPGTEKFDALVKSVATSHTRVGAAVGHGALMFKDIPRDLILAWHDLIEAGVNIEWLMRSAAMEIERVHAEEGK